VMRFTRVARARLDPSPHRDLRDFQGGLVGWNSKLALMWECKLCGCATLEDRCWYCGRLRSGELVKFEGDREDSQFELYGGDGP